MSEIELLPCAHCGAEAIFHENDWCEPSQYGVHCTDWKRCGAQTGGFMAKAAAIAAWNRRPAPVPPAGESGKTHELWIAVDEHGAPDLATLHVDESGCLHTMDEIGLMGFEPRRCTLSILEQAAESQSPLRQPSSAGATSEPAGEGVREAAKRLLEIDDTGLVKEDDVTLVANAILSSVDGERKGWEAMRETVGKAICCPDGCVRPDDCWSANTKEPGCGRRRKQADAVLAALLPLLSASPEKGERERALEEAVQRCLHVGSTLSNQYARRGVRACIKAIRARAAPQVRSHPQCKRRK